MGLQFREVVINILSIQSAISEITVNSLLQTSSKEMKRLQAGTTNTKIGATIYSAVVI